CRPGSARGSFGSSLQAAEGRSTPFRWSAGARPPRPLTALLRRRVREVSEPRRGEDRDRPSPWLSPRRVQPRPFLPPPLRRVCPSPALGRGGPCVSEGPGALNRFSGGRGSGLAERRTSGGLWGALRRELPAGRFAAYACQCAALKLKPWQASRLGARSARRAG